MVLILKDTNVIKYNIVHNKCANTIYSLIWSRQTNIQRVTLSTAMLELKQTAFRAIAASIQS